MSKFFLTITLGILLIILSGIVVYVTADGESGQATNSILLVNQTNSTSIIPKIATETFCLRGYSEDEYIQYFSKLNQYANAGASVEALFKRADFRNLITESKKDAFGGIQQLCFFDPFIAFELYGDFNENNNTIGIYNPGLTLYDSGSGEFVFDQFYSRGLGDMGVCEITGAVADGVVYRCGGGDGPIWFETVYFFSPSIGKSKILQDCSGSEDKVECKVDLLEF